MEKLAYLISRPADVPGPELRKALVEELAGELRSLGAMKIAIAVDDEDVAQGDAVAIRRSDPPMRALVSFWLHNSDDRQPYEDVLAREAHELAGYLVVESRPLLFEAPIGERAPGANLVTCIKRRSDLSNEEFIDRWNNEHRYVANEIQSTFSYVRNAVVRKLTPGAPDWDGIVEEYFPIEALTNPLVWYDCDSEEEYRRRLERMLDSVRAFLDLSVLESMPMSQYELG